MGVTKAASLDAYKAEDLDLYDFLASCQDTLFKRFLIQLNAPHSRFNSDNSQSVQAQQLITWAGEGDPTLEVIRRALHTVLERDPQRFNRTAGATPAENKTLDHAALRELLSLSFKDAQAFDAFIQENWPAIYGKFSEGHDRTTKVNILFKEIAPLALLRDVVLQRVDGADALYGKLCTKQNMDIESEVDVLKKAQGFIARFGVNALLARILLFDSELDAFVMDYFPELTSELGQCRDRLDKYVLLSGRSGVARTDEQQLQLLNALYHTDRRALELLDQHETAQVPTASSLRCALRAVLPDAQALLTFFAHHYPRLFARLGPHFDRLRIENTLLQGASRSDLLQKLSREKTWESLALSRLIEYELQDSSLPWMEALQNDLSSVLRLQSEVDAFCLDHFPNCFRRFTDGMSIADKLRLLINTESPAIIQRHLLERHSASLLPAGPATPAEGEPVLELSYLRRLLQGSLPNYKAIRDFCQLFFPETALYLMPLMDTTQLYNILLEKADPARLQACLKYFASEQFQSILKERRLKAR